MKTVIPLSLLVFTSLDLAAQGVFSNETNIALERVIQDYPNRFNNIKGAILLEDAKTTNYESSIKIPGSLSCRVTLFNGQRQTVSWKAELFDTGNFAEARDKYKEFYNQIKNTIIKIQGEKPCILNGQYESPEIGKQFHSIVFSLLPSAGSLQKVRVELSIYNQASLWRIQIAIYDVEEIDYSTKIIVQRQ
jgi:hypothetical protein